MQCAVVSSARYWPEGFGGGGHLLNWAPAFAGEQHKELGPGLRRGTKERAAPLGAAFFLQPSPTGFDPTAKLCKPWLTSAIL